MSLSQPLHFVRIHCACVGKGSFGHVKLVRDKRTGLTYALKAVSRKRIVELGQQEHIINEKKIMQQLECTFLIRLYVLRID